MEPIEGTLLEAHMPRLRVTSVSVASTATTPNAAYNLAIVANKAIESIEDLGGFATNVQVVFAGGFAIAFITHDAGDEEAA